MVSNIDKIDPRYIGNIICGMDETLARFRIITLDSYYDSVFQFDLMRYWVKHGKQ